MKFDDSDIKQESEYKNYLRGTTNLAEIMDSNIEQEERAKGCLTCGYSLNCFCHLQQNRQVERHETKNSVDHLINPSHGNGLLICLMCGKKMKTSMRNMRDHIRKVHLKKPLKCPMCDLVTKRKYDLQKHIYRMHKTSQSPIEGTQGEQSFLIRPKLVKMQKFACALEQADELTCGAQFQSTPTEQPVLCATIQVKEEHGIVKQMIKEDIQQPEFKLTDRGAPTPNIEHEISKSEVKTRRQCVLCPILTSSVLNMNAHVLNHFREHLLPSLPIDEPYTCPECGSLHGDLTTLLQHYAFGHKQILKYCNKYVLRGQAVTLG